VTPLSRSMPSDSRKRDRDRDDDRKSSRRDKDRDRDKERKHSRRHEDRDDDRHERRKHDKPPRKSRDEDERKPRKSSSAARPAPVNDVPVRETSQRNVSNLPAWMTKPKVDNVKSHDHHRTGRRDRDRSPDDSSDDSRRRKRSKHDRKSSDNQKRKNSHKSRSGEESRSKKSSHSDKKDRKHKSDRESRNPKVEIDVAKLVHIGLILNTPPASILNSTNDYFAFHNHLRLFLYRSEGKYFEDLSSDETHEAFEKFCSKYNNGELEQAYYNQDLPEEALEQCKRTKHAWKFKTSAAEEKSLDVIISGVKKQTAYDVKKPPSVKGPIILCAPVASKNVGDRPNRAVIPPRNDAKESQRVEAAMMNQNDQKREAQEAVLMSLGLGLKPGQKITIAPRK